MILTKSKYVEFAMCPRKSWLNLFEPQKPLDEENKRALEGQKVGEIARDYFGKNKCVMYDEKNPTTSPGIYGEYLLEYQNLKCYCDIVVINNDGSFDIYEVKSVTDYDKNKFLEDVSFQYYVAKKLNINVNSINLMYLNNEYVYDGINLELNKLFIYKDLTLEVSERIDIIEKNIENYFKLDKKDIPTCPFSKWCNENGGCQYLLKCKEVKKLPIKYSTYELYDCKNKNEYIENGLLTWEDIYNSEKYDNLSDYNKIMLKHYINKDNSLFIRNSDLKELMSTWKYPLYFFDFETCQEVIPIYANSRPYSQIPFQYSLHIMNNPNDTESEIINNHREFIGNGVDDPREDLIKQMIADLGNEGSIVAYYSSFEETVVDKLARDFPKYKKELLAIKERFVDLRDVFSYKKPYIHEFKRGDKKGTTEVRYEKGTTCLYHPSMENSTSIKKVLPSFFPDRDDLNYNNLNQVHHGQEAIDAYKLLRIIEGKDREELIDNMLKYCYLDTKAMVVLFLKFREYC